MVAQASKHQIRLRSSIVDRNDKPTLPFLFFPSWPPWVRWSVVLGSQLSSPAELWLCGYAQESLVLWTPSHSLHQLDVFDVSISWIFLIVIKGVLIDNSELTQKDGRGKNTALNLEWQAPPWEDSHIKVTVGDTRRFALGWKLQILVSLRVFRRKVTIFAHPGIA